MADDFERGGSKLYASLARSLADDPVVADIVGDQDPRWEAPLRLFGGVHYLELAGVVQHPWPKLPRRARGQPRLARPLRRRAPDPDERGAALLGPPARVPLDVADGAAST